MSLEARDNGSSYVDYDFNRKNFSVHFQKYMYTKVDSTSECTV
jgi:hypothetical protein